MSTAISAEGSTLDDVSSIVDSAKQLVRDATQLASDQDLDSLRQAAGMIQNSSDTLANLGLCSSWIATHLQHVLLKQYNHTGDDDQFDLCADIGKNSSNPTNLTNIDSPLQQELSKRQSLTFLAFLYRSRYEYLGATEDHSLAITHMSRALLTPRCRYPFESERYSDLGAWRLELYEESHDMKDLDQSIEAYDQALLYMPRQHPDSVWRCFRLAQVLLTRFQITESTEDLDDSIRVLQEAVRVIASDDSNRPSILANLSYCFQRVHYRSDDLEDLDKAIQALDEAQRLAEARKETQSCEVLPSKQYIEDSSIAVEGDENQYMPLDPGDDITEAPYLMLRLANLLWERWWLGKDEADLNRSIDFLEKSEALSKNDAKLHPIISSVYMKQLKARYGLIHTLEDIDKIILLYERTIESLKPDDPVRFEETMELASWLSNPFRYSDRLGDTDKAKKLADEVLGKTDSTHPNRAKWLMIHGSIQEGRFLTSGDPYAIADAVRVANEGIELAKQGDESQHHILFALGQFLAQMSRYTGNLNDLDKGIEAMDEALRIMDENPFQPGMLRCTLGWWYRLRFDRTGDARDLASAIQLNEEGTSVDESSNNLQTLAGCYATRYDKYSEADDLDKAIEVLQRWPEDKRGVNTEELRLSLAHHIYQRGKDRKIRGDIDESIRRQEELLKALPQGSQARWGCAYSLSSAVETRFLDFFPKSIEDINYSIHVLTENLDALLQEDMKALGLSKIGRLYSLRFLAADSQDHLDMEQSLNYYMQVFNGKASPLTLRIEASKVASTILDSLSRPDEGATILKQAINLLPALNLRFLSASDQQQVLKQIAGLSAKAAAMALRSTAGEHEALAILERGRGIISNLLTETRLDILALDPQTASQLLEAREAISALQSATSQQSLIDSPQYHHNPASGQLDFRARQAAETRLAMIIEKIESDPKAQQFFDPPSVDDVISVLGDDNIVIINASQHRCDAFIISKRTGLKVVELETLVIDDIEDKAKSLVDSRPRIDPSLLEWLWDTIAQPILEELELGGRTDDQDLPRLFWILTGPLTQLPIHAAGRHVHGMKETVLDQVISSYCQSLRRFVQSRKSEFKLADSSGNGLLGKALLVAMTQTPNRTTLANAAKEVTNVQNTCSQLHLEPLRLPNQTCAAVLAELGSHIFHFAGHGRSDARDPSQSGLLLEDGVLTVGQLREHNVQGNMPFLGYLSACLTAANDMPDLADEAIHLLTACQIAGFRHLIGSLWELYDDACAEMAEAVYKNLAGRNMTDRAVSEALHFACVRFRDEWLSTVSPATVPPSLRAGLSADLLQCDNDDQQSGRPGYLMSRKSRAQRGVKAHWVPYVHYGP